MSAPTLSVVLPARNAVATIERAARSILASTLRELELIVIDDGSTDDTAGVVRQIDDPIRLIRQKPGALCRSQQGHQRGSAPVIARMDADDFFHPKGSRNNSTSSGSLTSTWWDAGFDHRRAWPSCALLNATSGATRSPSQPHRTMRFVQLPIVNPTLMAKREVFELGYREGAWPEDYDLCLRAIGQGSRLPRCRRCCSTGSTPANGSPAMTHSPRHLTAAAAPHLIYGPLRGIREVDLWGAGQAGKPWLRWLQGGDSASDASSRFHQNRHLVRCPRDRRH